jgi:uncharacterized protein (TIGR02246 family)
MKQPVMFFLIAALLVPLVAGAEEQADRAADEASIQASVASYVAAFNSRDAAAVAAHWLPDAVYINRTTGEKVVGRDAIEKGFVAIFAQSDNLKLAATTDSIEFISPNVAVEHGAAKFFQPDAEPEEVAYTAVYVKQDGAWLLDRVTDDPVAATQSNYEQLKPLEWMIGSWVDADENARIVSECSWTKNQNFITRSFTVSIDDRIDISGMQIIGWDPLAKQVRSWVFDSDGGFAAGKWTNKQDRWFIQKRGVLSDGRKTSATNVIRPIDKNAYTLQSLARTVAGELLPNIDEVRVVRAAAADEL